MANQDTDLRCYLTNAGIAAENNSIQLGRKLPVKEMVFGSGLLADGSDPRLQTTMIQEEYAVPCGMLFDPESPTLLVFKSDLPADVGGFHIHEVAIRLEDGTLYGYARGKGDYKPTIEQGATDSVRYAVEMYTTNASNVECKVDLSKVYVDWEDLEARIKAHKDEPEPHLQYMKYGNSSAIWASMPIGHPFALELHTPGVEPPPTDNPRFRIIKLSSGDAYNAGILINEIVTGTAPVLSVTAEINFPQSPMHGQRIELRNTSKVFSRAGENGGIVVGDAIRNITAFVSLSDESLPNSIRGFINHSGAFKSTLAPSSIHAVASKSIGANVYPMMKSDVNLDASLVVPTANQNQPVHIEEPYFMRIF